MISTRSSSFITRQFTAGYQTGGRYEKGNSDAETHLALAVAVRYHFVEHLHFAAGKRRLLAFLPSNQLQDTQLVIVMNGNPMPDKSSSSWPGHM